MNYLILIRHGQSKWNLEKRFTGWVDVELTKEGELEAEKAGNLIKKKKYFDRPILFISSVKSQKYPSNYSKDFR